MPAKNVQTLKARNTVVRYRDTHGKWRSALVTATNGAGGVVTMRVQGVAAQHALTSKSKVSSLHGTDAYDNRH